MSAVCIELLVANRELLVFNDLKDCMDFCEKIA